MASNTSKTNPTKFKDLNTAARLKGIVERIADRRIVKAIPPIRYAVVTAVDTTTRYATAGFPDEAGVVGSEFTLRMGGLEPSVGSLIRVAGPIGARYIDDVLTGVVTLNDGVVPGEAGGSGASSLDPFYADYVSTTDTSARLPIMATSTVVSWYITMTDTAALVLDVLVNGVAAQRLNLAASVEQVIASTVPQLLDGDLVQIQVIDAAGGGASGLTIIGKL